MRTRQRLVIIGAGMAAARLVRELAATCPGRFATTLLGAEPHLPYDRIRLSSILAGQGDVAELALLPAGLDDVTCRTGVRVVAIDREARTVALAGGERLGYDQLVLATGSDPLRLPLPGLELEGVQTFRDLADVAALSNARGAAVVIGGGLLGLEAVHGLRARGVAVTVVHLMPWLMERQLDREAGAILARELEARGIALRLAAKTEAIIGDGRVAGVRLAGGEVLSAELVVLAVGIRPNAALAGAAGLAVNRGVVVDDGLATADPRIAALGECAEHRGIAYGLVAPAYEQAATLARRLAGDTSASYGGSTVATSLKVSGLRIYSAGSFADDAPGDRLIYRDAARGIYRKLVVEGGLLKGAVLTGETRDGPWFAELVAAGTPIEPWRADLIFGRAHVERRHEPALPLAA